MEVEKMNKLTTIRIRHLGFLAAGITLWCSVNMSSAADISQILQSLQGLSQDQQNQLLNQVAGQISGTTTTGTTTTGTTSTGTSTSTTTGMPLGKAAINYVLKWHPGKAVAAAAAGTPIVMGEMFTQPVDQPDFWDNVKTVFLSGLAQAITNVTGIPISTNFSSTSPVSTAGQ
jgi:hypothetical protein